MSRDKISFEIKWLPNDRVWLLRVMHNGTCVLAPREDNVRDCLIAANEYCEERLNNIRKKVQITINYE